MAAIQPTLSFRRKPKASTSVRIYSVDYLFGKFDRRIDGDLAQLRSAPLSRNEVFLAASELRRMRETSRSRKRTGAINGKRVRKGSAVILPDGKLAEVCGATRGLVIVRVRDPRLIGGEVMLVAKEHEVTVPKLACAVALGTLKAGCVEKPSEKKLAACRRNARCPAKPGRRRGRPRGTVNLKPTQSPAVSVPERPPTSGFAAMVEYYSRKAGTQPW